MYTIEFVGNEHTNRSKRIDKDTKREYKPMAICNHISAGSLGSMINTFTSPKNKKSSAHFGVGRKGEVVQFVAIEDNAWTQGIVKSDIPYAKADIVKAVGVNPNLYCVSIEFEGYEGNGIDGSLTDEQFKAGVWLHKYIQQEIYRIYGELIPLNAYNVLGHCMIDPKRKPLCPGINFPYQRLYAELATIQDMTMEAYEERLSFEQDERNLNAEAYQIAQRILDLYNKSMDTNNKYQKEARRKLLAFKPFMKQQGML